MATPADIHHQLHHMSDDQLLELEKCVSDLLSTRHSNGYTANPPVGLMPACRLLTVSEGVRRLDKAQLETLAQAFGAWVEEARDSRTRRSRERVFIIFLVLRYTGARLGEVLTLDEHADIDFGQGLVILRRNGEEGNDREVRHVPLPEDVVERIRIWCETNVYPTHATEGERLFRLDQGFLRRKFYEQEKRCALPRELLNPRVLRNSRAIELLQGGMPMRAVQALLGHTTADLVSSYVTLADEDLKNITQQYCRVEFSMETSARNTFHGTVIRVVSNPVLSEVVLKTDSGYEVAAVITNQSREKLGLAEGKPATALVKATWVILDKGAPPLATSPRNAFPGVVTSVISDDVVTEVQGKLADGTPVCALVTAGSFKKLKIGEGDSFVFMFKAMSVIVS